MYEHILSLIDDEENVDEPEMSFFILLLDKLLPLHEAQGKGVR